MGPVVSMMPIDSVLHPHAYVHALRGCGGLLDKPDYARGISKVKRGKAKKKRRGKAA
jgi:hypothetical protein